MSTPEIYQRACVPPVANVIAVNEPDTPTEPAIDVFFIPQFPNLPIEVVERRGLMARMPDRHLHNLQRARFHQLIFCTGGTGIHHVDFAPHAISPGTVLHIRPGQMQKFSVDPDFDALMVIWPAEHDPSIPQLAPWYPGGGVPTALTLGPDEFAQIEVWIAALRAKQEQFNDTRHAGALMRTILTAILLLLDEYGCETDQSIDMPQPYLALREALERRLHERPTTRQLAEEIGYSARTLDRACKSVSGQTAKQVIDERVSLELRRLLGDRSRAMGSVRSSFGFTEASNFTKFVRRHLGQSPREFRLELGVN